MCSGVRFGVWGPVFKVKGEDWIPKGTPQHVPKFPSLQTRKFRKTSWSIGVRRSIGFGCTILPRQDPIKLHTRGLARERGIPTEASLKRDLHCGASSPNAKCCIDFKKAVRDWLEPVNRPSSLDPDPLHLKSPNPAGHKLGSPQTPT
jgi:hypothetical protein